MPAESTQVATQDTTTVADGSAQAGATEQAKASDGTQAATEQTQAQTTAPAQGSNDQATDQAETAPVYDLKLPADSALDDKIVTSVKEFAEANKLTADAAQSLLEHYDTQAKAYEQSVLDQIAAQQRAWKEAIAKDQEIGGDKTKAASEHAYRLFEKLGTPELKQFLEESKFGEHPEVLRIFARIGARMAEDRFEQSGTSSGERSLAQRMYPSNG